MHIVPALVAALAAGPSLVSAIRFTSPAANVTLTEGRKVTLNWTSVDTDPNDLSIYLVNFVDWPPFYTPLALGVKTTLGSYEVTVPCGINASSGYQFNAINGTNTYIIYAQTPKFSIKGGSCSATDPTPQSAYTCPTASVVTVTVTASATANCGSVPTNTPNRR